MSPPSSGTRIVENTVNLLLRAVRLLFGDPRWPPAVGNAGSPSVSVVVGIFLLASPVSTAVALVTIMAVFGIVGGAIEVVRSVIERDLSPARHRAPARSAAGWAAANTHWSGQACAGSAEGRAIGGAMNSGPTGSWTVSPTMAAMSANASASSLQPMT